ncbi:MYXO-CTERM sorting domain-containing protein [Mesorhizobium sp. NPDC059025]|uniref:MYXO-CTERM sorting domain-containing protein n=1 Tax=unclassified Mesorhizobium TaxID=325217 RepID=UPI0036966C7E
MCVPARPQCCRTGSTDGGAGAAPAWLMVLFALIVKGRRKGSRSWQPPYRLEG